MPEQSFREILGEERVAQLIELVVQRARNGCRESQQMLDMLSDEDLEHFRINREQSE